MWGILGMAQEAQSLKYSSSAVIPGLRIIHERTSGVANKERELNDHDGLNCNGRSRPQGSRWTNRRQSTHKSNLYLELACLALSAACDFRKESRILPYNL